MFKIIFVFFVPLLMAGTQELSESEIEQAIQKADSYTLYSLEPSISLGTSESEEKGSGKKVSTKKFHGWRILGKTKIDSKQQNSIAKVFSKALKNYAEDDYMCFNPRHGIRISRKGQPQLDLVICFECGKFTAYHGKKDREGMYFKVGNDADAVATFNSVLKTRGIQLPPPPSK